jgi:hypothetical protein
MIKNYQTAIVTGASHGIGPFIVRALAMDLFPGMGSMMGQMGAPVMKQVVAFREQQREQMDASQHHPEEQR